MIWTVSDTRHVFGQPSCAGTLTLQYVLVRVASSQWRMSCRCACMSLRHMLVGCVCLVKQRAESELVSNVPGTPREGDVCKFIHVLQLTTTHHEPKVQSGFEEEVVETITEGKHHHGFVQTDNKDTLFQTHTHTKVTHTLKGCKRWIVRLLDTELRCQKQRGRRALRRPKGHTAERLSKAIQTFHFHRGSAIPLMAQAPSGRNGGQARLWKCLLCVTPTAATS